MNTTMVAYGSLLVAIVCEIIATSFLKQSEQFSRLIPSIITIVGYVCSFYMLSVTLKYMPIGIAYAIWSGLGIVVISIIGFIVFKQRLDLAACIGLGFIVLGVIIVNVFSKSAVH